jgi:hypothetical protein
MNRWPSIRLLHRTLQNGELMPERKVFPLERARDLKSDDRAANDAVCVPSLREPRRSRICNPDALGSSGIYGSLEAPSGFCEKLQEAAGS